MDSLISQLASDCICSAIDKKVNHFLSNHVKLRTAMQKMLKNSDYNVFVNFCSWCLEKKKTKFTCGNRQSTWLCYVELAILTPFVTRQPPPDPRRERDFGVRVPPPPLFPPFLRFWTCWHQRVSTIYIGCLIYRVL
jgi:hypothetical protein